MSGPRSSPSGRSSPASDRSGRAPDSSAAPASSERAPGGNETQERVFGILTRYVSPPTARSILTLAQQRGGATGAVDLRQLLDSIEHSLRLFVTDPVQVRMCRTLLDELVDTLPASSAAVVVAIYSEADIVKARSEGRRVAQQVGFSTVGLTRLMTAVSEVTRNIVLYAGQGHIEIVPTTVPRGVEVIARDRGPGIRNLEQIFAGNYKSRHGMGLGLRGVKKLAEQFDIQTAPGSGTTVRFVLGAA
jgi:serine/threonine-protein kinase RsbT